MRIDSDKARAALAKLFADLRGNRLWPLAIVLLVAIVAVPIALSKSSTGTPVASAPQGAPPPAPGTAVPALNVQTTSGHSRLPGHGRDPFTQQALPKPKSTTSSSTTASSSSATTGATGTGSSGSASSGSNVSVSPAPTSSSTAPPTITPNKKPAPAPPGLTGTQSYGVTLALSDSTGGGLSTIDRLLRLSPLPSVNQPLLVELGVLKGGHRVLFAVQPGTALNGPGTCTPGPIDCEILSLGQDQTEGLSVQSTSGPTQVALFAVTGISAVNYPSLAAADRVRRQESAAGRNILDASTLDALSLFQYQPSIGAVVDLSNLQARDP